MALIIDTGPLIALMDRTDPDHARCAGLIATAAERRIVPLCVLVEVEYMLRPWPGAFGKLMADISAGRLEVHTPERGELERAGSLVLRYADLPLGFVDATVLAAVERFAERKLATLDHRHFTVVRPAHADHLELLPR